MKIHIRETNDLKEIQYLNKKIFPQEPLDLSKPVNFHWLAFHKRRPVGFASMYILPNEPDWVFFSRAGVLDEYQGLGIHSRFISVRKRAVAKHNLKGAITYTVFWNAKSSRNLENRGFRIYQPEEYWAGEVIYFQWENPKYNDP